MGDSYQYNDLPQIHIADNSPLNINGWPNEYPAQMNFACRPKARTVTVFGEDVVLDSHQNMSSMERFLSGSEMPPYAHGFLRTNPNFGYEHAGNYHYSPQYGTRAPPFPANDANLPRDPSPETISSYDSHGPQNELRSPHSLEQASYGSPTDYSQSRLPYADPQLRTGGAYSPSPPLVGGGIDPRNTQYEHDEPAQTVEEFDHVDKLDLNNYEQDTPYCKMEVDQETTYQTDSAIGHSLRDPESVHPVSPDAESDYSDYKPTSKPRRKRRTSQSSNGSGGRQTQKRTGHSRKSSTTSTAHSNRVKKTTTSHSSNRSATSNGNANAARPFPCPLALYGCTSTFSSKNEWKRHVSTQHIKMGFWRCDLCPTTVDTHDPSTIYHNDFNRKDLFTQHLRRMHAAPTNQPAAAHKNIEYPINDDNIGEHQTRCYQSLRSPPSESSCLFCDRTFSGPGSWDERMEHVGRHLEKDRKNGGAMIDIKDWQEDHVLREWLINENLLEVDSNGAAHLSNGARPRNRNE